MRAGMPLVPLLAAALALPLSACSGSSGDSRDSASAQRGSARADTTSAASSASGGVPGHGRWDSAQTETAELMTATQEYFQSTYGVTIEEKVTG